MDSSRIDSQGVIQLVTATVIFGTLTLYWQMLDFADCMDILAHRCFWAAITLLPIILLAKPKLLLQELRANWHLLLLSTAMLGINWYSYVWAVNHDLVLDTSIAYYIAPLGSMLAGSLILGESLNGLQRTSIILVILGIFCKILTSESFPAMALIIGGSFVIYGVVGKQMRMRLETRLGIETIALSVVLALSYGFAGQLETTWNYSLSELCLLATTGVVTVCPLLLFVSGIRRLPLTLVGALHFIAPTLIFLTGITFFDTITFTKYDLWAFVLIWAGVACYLSAILPSRRRLLARG